MPFLSQLLHNIHNDRFAPFSSITEIELLHKKEAVFEMTASFSKLFKPKLKTVGG